MSDTNCGSGGCKSFLGVWRIREYLCVHPSGRVQTLVESVPRHTEAVLAVCGGPKNNNTKTLYVVFSFNMSPVCMDCRFESHVFGWSVQKGSTSCKKSENHSSG